MRAAWLSLLSPDRLVAGIYTGHRKGEWGRFFFLTIVIEMKSMYIMSTLGVFWHLHCNQSLFAEVLVLHLCTYSSTQLKAEWHEWLLLMMSYPQGGEFLQLVYNQWAQWWDNHANTWWHTRRQLVAQTFTSSYKPNQAKQTHKTL